MKKFFAMMLALVMVLSLAACGAKAPADDAATPDDGAVEDTKVVYAVEAGSAGEAAAQDNGFEFVSVETQATALMEVQAGTSDAAIIDSLMAAAMVGEGTSYPDLVITDQKLTEELYGAGCRKDSDLTSFINEVFYETYTSGKLQEIAATYGVEAALIEMPEAAFEPAAENSDVEYIKANGKLVVGITDFAPMDYKDENGEWIGFDADMAKIVAEKLGVECVFVEIDWGSKIMELDAKNIDVVWNGMTLTDAVVAAMNCTNPYCNNAQVVITK